MAIVKQAVPYNQANKKCQRKRNRWVRCNVRKPASPNKASQPNDWSTQATPVAAPLQIETRKVITVPGFASSGSRAASRSAGTVRLLNAALFLSSFRIKDYHRLTIGSCLAFRSQFSLPNASVLQGNVLHVKNERKQALHPASSLTGGLLCQPGLPGERHADLKCNIGIPFQAIVFDLDFVV